jgi:hypothetical protein
MSAMKRYLLLLIFTIGIRGWIHAQSTDTTTQDPGYQSSQKSSATQSSATSSLDTQSPDPQKKVSPLQRATRQLTVLQDKLNLNQNQVVQLRMILLNANISLDSLRSNPSGDQKADNKSRRAILQDADLKTYALLNTDQQLVYAQWKVQQKQMQQQKAMEKRMNQAATDSTSPKQ